MPFLVEVDESARLIADAIADKRAELAFPLPTATVTRMARWLPNRIYDSLVRRLAPQG